MRKEERKKGERKEQPNTRRKRKDSAESWLQKPGRFVTVAWRFRQLAPEELITERRRDPRLEFSLAHHVAELGTDVAGRFENIRRGTLSDGAVPQTGTAKKHGYVTHASRDTMSCPQGWAKHGRRGRMRSAGAYCSARERCWCLGL